MQIVQTVSMPQGLMLCRCFCRHYQSLTGAGLAALARRTEPATAGDQDNE